MTSADQSNVEIAVPAKTAGQVAVSANNRAIFAIAISVTALTVSVGSLVLNYTSTKADVAAQASPIVKAPVRSIRPIPQSSEMTPVTPPELKTDDVQIIPDGNNIYAYVKPTQEWLVFKEGNPTPETVDTDKVPAQVKNVAGKSANNTAIDLKAVEAQAKKATNNLAAITDPDPELKVNLLLEDPKTAAGILEGLSRLKAIHVPGAVRSGDPVMIFFDPRCPYCHQAFKQLDGKVDMLWIPTLALGDPSQGSGAARLMASLGNMSVKRDDAGAISDVILETDPERIARFREVMSNNSWPGNTPNELDGGAQFITEEAMTILRQLYSVGNTSNMLAVPTFIVPNEDGTASMYRGLDDTIINMILNPSQKRGNE